jgi:hypothetical protein
LFCRTQLLIASPEPQGHFPPTPFLIAPRNGH